MPPKSSYSVLIVGCGDIGSRHLQAVASLPQVQEIEVVDPRPEGLALGRRRISEVADRALGTSYRWLSSLDEAKRDGDLCIVATQAEGRGRLVQEIAAKAGYRRFLVEKLVSQSLQEYQDLLAFVEEKGLSVWVNCKSRAHPSHKRVKASLNPGEPIVFSTVGGNHGLANNGIHIVDLFSFYDDATRIESGGAHIDPILHPSKRRGPVYDLSGTLCGHTAKGSQFTLTFAPGHDGPAHYSVCSPRYRAIIDDMVKCYWESDRETGWLWRQVHFEANLMISNMTRAFAADILASGRCELPTLKDCLPAHRFILEELQPHFARLLGVELDRCPVT